ncbi:MAG: PEGA domain-containing protein [Deltaproteobacteria bacterium]|nr:PEGA domain-containing protein [Deltaproteobacteria bacterium]
MATRFRALAALVLTIAFLVSPLSVAQPKQPTILEELPAEAHDDWNSAKQLYADGNFNGAAVHFRQVYQASKNPRVLFNIGVCQKKLGRYAEAISTWEKQLAFRSKLTEATITKVERAIATLQEYVSTLDVKANEAGAKLFIDGREVGETPFLAPVRIDVGEQKLVLKKEGFKPAEKTITVAKGKPAKVTFELEPEALMTRVTVTVEGAPKARVFVDGVDMGPAPFEGEVTAERHTFKAVAKGYADASQTSEVVHGEPFSLKLSMVKMRNEGKVKVVTGYQDAVIEIDGKVVGTGAWEGVLKAGGHRLVVRKDGYETHTSDLALSPGQDRTVRLSLEAEHDTAWIWWTATLVAVVAGGGVASYFVFRPAETSEVTGTLNPGVVPTTLSF